MSQPEPKEKEVFFGHYCQICKYGYLTDDKEPCCECLKHPSNWDSHRPVKWEQK